MRVEVVIYGNLDLEKQKLLCQRIWAQIRKIANIPERYVTIESMFSERLKLKITLFSEKAEPTFSGYLPDKLKGMNLKGLSKETITVVQMREPE